MPWQEKVRKVQFCSNRKSEVSNREKPCCLSAVQIALLALCLSHLDFLRLVLDDGLLVLQRGFQLLVPLQQRLSEFRRELEIWKERRRLSSLKVIHSTHQKNCRARLSKQRQGKQSRSDAESAVAHSSKAAAAAYRCKEHFQLKTSKRPPSK